MFVLYQFDNTYIFLTSLLNMDFEIKEILQNIQLYLLELSSLTNFAIIDEKALDEMKELKAKAKATYQYFIENQCSGYNAVKFVGETETGLLTEGNLPEKLKSPFLAGAKAYKDYQLPSTEETGDY